MQVFKKMEQPKYVFGKSQLLGERVDLERGKSCILFLKRQEKNGHNEDSTGIYYFILKFHIFLQYFYLWEESFNGAPVIKRLTIFQKSRWKEMEVYGFQHVSLVKHSKRS